MFLIKKKLIHLINNGVYRIGIFSFFLFTEEKKIQVILQHWTRTLQIKFGWIHEFDNIVVNYTNIILMVDNFKLSSRQFKILSGHTSKITNVDSTFDEKFICSGSFDNTVRIWDIETTSQVQEYKHLDTIHCVKFSQYHYHYHHQNVIYFSSEDKTICFWNFNNNTSQILDCYTKPVYCIELSSFSGGRYLCSGSDDNIIRLWDVETSKSLCDFIGHNMWVRSITTIILV
ncbi:NACHT and WD40 domain protein [Reticulomyxa filosa]|uniref:NACHT and WD40 domain protein n=1 Tax=Reticulomyxa filosa TaxID=46433 RepID=X6MWE4_RETFI|nr:NACHT and WD40 domain protein [Reticulomyxa filosa]|eukprot:ETO17385.1 NACHT and WD40 domain protein [Reticulomyxa filosa]